MLKNICREDNDNDLEQRCLEIADAVDMEPAGEFCFTCIRDICNKERIDPKGEDEEHKSKQKCINCQDKRYGCKQLLVEVMEMGPKT